MSKRPTIYTWGYGKDRTMRDLLNSMADAGVLGMEDELPFVAVDVRETRGSRNRDWDFSQFGPLGSPFVYEWAHRLGNTTRKAGVWFPRNEERAAEWCSYYRGRLDAGDCIVLVCTEADPMRPPLKGHYHPRTKCHRVLVAKAIAQFKSPNAEIEHL